MTTLNKERIFYATFTILFFAALFALKAIGAPTYYGGDTGIHSDYQSDYGLRQYFSPGCQRGDHCPPSG